MKYEPQPHPRRSGIWEITRWAVALSILAWVAWLPHTSALFFALCAGTHVESHEADLNHDGYVSLSEAGYACNVDSRPVSHHGRVCTEVYNRVDWRPIKEYCD